MAWRWEAAVGKRYRVMLRAAEREALGGMLSRGKADARRLADARVLLQADASEGGAEWRDLRIAEAVRVSVGTLERVLQRCVEDGLEALLRQPSRRVCARKLDGEREAKLVAVACSGPTPGKKRWTGLCRRDRHCHGDGRPLRPRAAPRAGVGLDPVRPLAAACRPGGALRRGDDGGHEHRGGGHAALSGLLAGRAGPPIAAPPSKSCRAHGQLARARPGPSRPPAPRPGSSSSPCRAARPTSRRSNPAGQGPGVRCGPEARTPEALDAALAPALDSITPAEAHGWFNQCAYPCPNQSENRSSILSAFN